MLRFLPAVLASLLALPAALAAQPPAQAGQPAATIEIRGRIVDTAGAPLPNAAVSLRPKGSTTTIAGAMTGREGQFRIAGLRPGTYSIRAAYIGYAPVIEDLTLTPDKPIVELGLAKLAPMAMALSDVEVQEERATVVTEPDRNTYTAKDIAPGASNASELLENVPSVQVDVDGKVSLRGNENVVVQINGRPTPMRGTQLAAYLKSLSANIVDRIEVIPNPSAKHDPEGMAGIINVALKSNVDLGLSGSVTTAVSNADRYNTSGSIGYQSGPWTSFVSAGIVSDERRALGINDRERYDAANALLSTTSQDILLRPAHEGQNLNVTVDYKLNSRDVLSNALMLNRRSSEESSNTTQTLFDASGSSVDQFVRPRNVESKGFMFDYDVALKRTFTPRTHELSTEFRFNRSDDEDVNDERRLASSGSSYTDRKIERNDAINQQLTGQVDYVRTLRPRTKLETGWKSIVRWTDRDLDVSTDASGDGTWTPSAQSNSLELDEGVHAAYATMSQGVGKWELQGGLRGEYATRTFRLSAERFPYDYASLFPSAIASYTVSEGTQVKASYSRRVRRPGTQELNPFPTYFDADNVFFGNPDLRAEYTDAFEIGLTKTGKLGMLQLSPFYRSTSDVIRVDINTTDTLDSREITSISFQNLASSNSWGADLTGQLRLSPRFSALSNFSLFKVVTDGGSTSAVGSNAVGWMGRLNLTSEITPTLTAQAAYNYRAPMKIERGEFAAQQMMFFVFRRKIQGDQGAILLRVVDPFEMMRFRVRTGDGAVLQVTERDPRSRVVFLGYQYNFGRPPRVRQVIPEQTGGGSIGFGTP